MQNKDFDRFIQQALENQPEPEYNPADWDLLEDRLHNLHASQPKPGNPAVGSSLGKLGFAATAILVTALNVVFFTQPELFKSASSKLAAVQNAILSETKTNEIPASTPADNTTVAASETRQPAQGLETGEATTSDGPETGATITDALPVVTPLENTTTVAVLKPANGSVKPNNTNKTRTNRNTAKPATGFAWTPSAAGQPGQISGAGLAGGKPVVTAINPCGIARPELAAALAGNDTVRGSKIAVSSCQLLTARFVPKGAANNNLKITSNIAKVLPGAKLVTEGGQTVLQFQPKPEMARQQPYSFTVWLTDERCPDVAVRAYQYALSVTPAFTAAINGNTKLEAGQGTTLEVNGAPAGSSYKWLVGKEVVADRETNRLAIMPLKTTTYRLAVTSPAGCTFSDSVKIEVAAKQVAVNDVKAIPNIFTPNGDGINDQFEITLPEEGAFDLVIFDRWGKQVYSRKDYDNRWNAANLENGTYYYVITTRNAKRTYKGWVEVLR